MVEWTAIPTEKMKRDAVSISLVLAVTVDIYRIFYKTMAIVLMLPLLSPSLFWKVPDKEPEGAFDWEIWI